jgi:hypothetical protein
MMQVYHYNLMRYLADVDWGLGRRLAHVGHVARACLDIQRMKDKMTGMFYGVASLALHFASYQLHQC